MFFKIAGDRPQEAFTSGNSYMVTCQLKGEGTYTFLNSVTQRTIVVFLFWQCWLFNFFGWFRWFGFYAFHVLVSFCFTCDTQSNTCKTSLESQNSKLAPNIKHFVITGRIYFCQDGLGKSIEVRCCGPEG